MEIFKESLHSNIAIYIWNDFQRHYNERNCLERRTLIKPSEYNDGLVEGGQWDIFCFTMKVSIA